MSQLWRGISKLYDALVVPSFGAPGYEANARLWTEPACPEDLSGRHIVVTGANSGIGLAATLQLARHGATVHMVCRDEARGRQAAEDVARQGATPVLHVADMSDFDSVAQWCNGFLAGSYPLDAVVHNAGALVHDRRLTSQNLELTFACHVAGPFLANRLLLPRLSEPDPGGRRKRVVFVSSGGMYTQKLRVAQLARGADAFDGVIAYAQAKRAQVLLAHRYAEAFADLPIAFSSMHPGWVETPGVAASLPTFDRVTHAILRTPAQGADTVVWLAASDAADGARGEFYFDRAPRREHLPLQRTRSSAADVDALWELLERLTAPFS